ncbi:MAG: CsbD family protein [Microbacteriaceae bacterium]|nr:CsbD family protein [Microbacteriaceae bacterium]
MGLDDKIKNAAKTVVGKGKEVIGNVTNNDELKAEGQADQAAAKVGDKVEDVKDALK